jgi:MFS family permease
MSSTLDTAEPGAAGAQAADAAEPYRWRWVVLFIVLAAEVMDLLDATIVNVAAPSIRRDLGGSYSALQWIAAGYTLAMAVMLITGGRLGDIAGRRRMFLIGAAGFTASSALCALAQSPEMLIGSRVLQGALGAIMLPQGLGLIRMLFPPKEMSTAFGLFGPVMGLSAVGGPVLAGVLINADLFGTGWRMLFLINVPLGLFALVGAWRFMPESRSDRAPRLDLPGMLLVTAGSVLVIYPLVEGRELGWPAWSFALMAAAVPVFAAFAACELRRQRAGSAPLIEPSLFRNRAYTSGLAVTAIFFAGMAGFMLVFGLYVQLGTAGRADDGPVVAGHRDRRRSLGRRPRPEVRPPRHARRAADHDRRDRRHLRDAPPGRHRRDRLGLRAGHARLRPRYRADGGAAVRHRARRSGRPRSRLRLGPAQRYSAVR